MITLTTVSPQISSWRAVEALRAGVPNNDVVMALGCSHPLVEERFRSMPAETDLGFYRGEGTQGVLLAGDFGAGKSHLLEYFQHIALENNFVCSKVVVSKETPLYIPSKVYAAAVQAAKVPNRSGTVLAAVAEDLDFDCPEYQDFYRWVFSPRTVLNFPFAASTFVFERGSSGRYPEVSDRILQFWAGARVPATELRGWLKELGEVATYKLEKVSELELSLQRYEFMSRLIRATGYAGWVILVDEVELMGRYSVMQRAKSYAEMSRLLGLAGDDRTPGLSTVFAITSAYQSEVMDQKQDEEKIALRLRDRGNPGDHQLSEKAELGMRKIRQLPMENMILAENADLRQVHEKSRAMYRQAYGWNPPEDYETNPIWRIRQHIKRWINGWDLVRLYPDYQPDIQVSGLQQSYSEDLDLEDPWDEEGVDPAAR